MNKLEYPILRFAESNNWELMRDFHKVGITAKKNFITDLASIPRIFWSIVPPFGKWIPATVIHDWLYRTNHKYSRKESDKILLIILRQDGVNIILSKLMYFSVRAFGRSRWNKFHHIKHS